MYSGVTAWNLSNFEFSCLYSVKPASTFAVASGDSAILTEDVLFTRYLLYHNELTSSASPHLTSWDRAYAAYAQMYTWYIWMYCIRLYVNNECRNPHIYYYVEILHQQYPIYVKWSKLVCIQWPLKRNCKLVNAFYHAYIYWTSSSFTSFEFILLVISYAGFLCTLW